MSNQSPHRAYVWNPSSLLQRIIVFRSISYYSFLDRESHPIEFCLSLSALSLICRLRKGRKTIRQGNACRNVGCREVQAGIVEASDLDMIVGPPDEICGVLCNQFHYVGEIRESCKERDLWLQFSLWECIPFCPG